MNNVEKKKIYDALLFTVLFLAIVWVAYLVEAEFGIKLKQYGLKPRKLEGLVGIFTVHFLHSNLEHIFNNTWAFLALNTYFFYFYRSIALKVFVFLAIAAPLFLWAWGFQEGNHIGLSIMVYALASFLFFSGLFRGSLQLMAVSALVVFSYGSMLWGIFPLQQGVSWDGHLAGGIMGLILSYYFKDEGPQRAKYQWEMEEEWEEELKKRIATDSTNEVEIKYHYREKPKSESNGTPKAN